MKTVSYFVFAVVLLLSKSVFAADVQAIQWQPLFFGIDHGVIESGAGTQLPLVINILRIDLAAEGISFVTTPSNGDRPLETDSQTTEDFLIQNNLQAAVNASYFEPCCNESPEPKNILGLAISEGEVISENETTEGYMGAAVLAIRPGNEVQFYRADEKIPASQLQTAVSAGPMLLKDGKILEPEGGQRHPRTAAGISADGRYLYWITIDGRQPGYSMGATYNETAKWLLEIGAVDGMNFDGGGSTGMVIADPQQKIKYLNRPSGGKARIVANSIGVRAKPIEQAGTHAKAQSQKENDWDTRHIKNELIDLEIVPEIGGRVLQYNLGDYGFFLVNKQLYGQTPPASGVGPNNAWLNYGGDKLWLAPQGWDNDQQWPGPPDAVLDGQPYTLQIIGPKEIKLTSRPDSRSGMQLSRTIKMFEGTTRVSIDASMKNIDNKSRRWGIWAHAQFNAGNRHGEGYNQNYWAYCPLNPNSVFLKKYDVQYGLVNNMSFKPDYEKGMMKVHYMRRVGKIGIDSPAGWVATVDGTDGYAFVQRFTYEPKAAYPDNSSVEIWHNGLGEFVAWGKINTMVDDPIENPYNFESELISPYAQLKPGQEYSFHYDWYSAKIPTGSEVIDCTVAGVVCQPLTAVRKGDNLTISGKFGVFYRGKVKAVLLDKKGKVIKAETPALDVTPLESIELNTDVDGSKEIAKAAKVSIMLFEEQGKQIGELANTSVSAN